MKCLYIDGWTCLNGNNEGERTSLLRSLLLEECKFCLEIRQRWVTLIKLVEEDYARNIQELTALREEKRRWEAMPK